MPRLDGREVPGPGARRAEPDRDARPDARRRGLAAAGGARHRRGEPAVRGVLRAPRAGEADREPARQADRGPHRDRHDPVPRHRVPRRGQPADGAQARPARAERGGHVRPRPRGAAAERGAAQEGGPGRAGQLPAADAREPGHARDGQGQVRAGPGRGRQADPAAHRDHDAEPAGRRAGGRPPGLPGPGRAARRVRRDGADHRLLRLLPPGRLHRGTDHRADRHRDGRAEPHRPVRREEPRAAARRDPGELRAAVQERPEALRLPAPAEPG